MFNDCTRQEKFACILKALAHVLVPLYSISLIEAKYKPRTHQELRYLNFDLAKWVQEKIAKNAKYVLLGQLRWQNDRKAILYNISFIKKVERVHFHPLDTIKIQQIPWLMFFKALYYT